MNINMSSPTSYIQSIPSTIHSTLPPSLHPFFLLSYPVRPSTSRLTSLFESTKPETLYSKGPEDVYIVITCAIGFTILREFTMRYVLSPLARYLIDRPPPNAKSLTRPEERLRRRRVRHLVTRFAEQGWSFLYCTAFWTIGGVSLTHPHMLLALLMPRSSSGASPPLSPQSSCGALTPSPSSPASRNSITSLSSDGGFTRST